MIKPANFDASKKYPVIIDVYGEPAGATVQDVWGGGDLWHQYLANQGYIVVSIENRGATAPRGREWRKCIYGEVGTFASAKIRLAVFLIWHVSIPLLILAVSVLPAGAAVEARR